MRAEILSIWNQLFFGPVQRQEQFPVFSSTDTSEETLRAHEIYLESLQALIPVYRPILDKEEQRQGWQSRVINLAKSTHDADFFKQKNVHKILAEEEKVRDIGKKQLPELEKEMEALLAQWEQANKSPFLYNGTKLIEIIKADQEKRKALLPVIV